MTLENLETESLAREWTARVVVRMTESGLPREEIEETAFIIYQLSRVAITALKQDSIVKLPERAETCELDEEKAFQVLELFIRSISAMAKTLRDIDTPERLPWERRREILEEAAWETFTMARIVIAGFYLPGFAREMIRDEKDLQVVMRQSTSEILKKYLPPHMALKKQMAFSSLDPALTYDPLKISLAPPNGLPQRPSEKSSPERPREEFNA